MSSTLVSNLGLDDLSGIDITLMTLRKPTELKKVIDSVPKPVRSVPKNGLPLWYRLGLECKLPVPKMPVGKITFSRGKMGEDVRRVGLGGGGPQPNFDLTDPYCNNVSYDYVPMHDPHLAHHFSQKAARNRMKELGFCTKDGRAVCSLKEFNQYRKYLYNQFMDRIHQTMIKLDERARDDLTLKKVEVDVARRLQIFTKSERAREHLEKVAQEHADEWAEKRRLAKEQEKKIQMRMNYLAEYNERTRKERAARAFEKQNRIKQRVQAAAEMELRRKITMVRLWRTNEKKRLSRLKQERETKAKFLESEANRKWTARVQAQNKKIQEEALLLKLYTEDMNAGAARRAKKAEVYAYNTDLELQRIRLANWKLMHGGHAKAAQLVRKMGEEFEKSKRGAKGMSPEYALKLAAEAMSTALSTQGDTLMTLGQARIRMDIETVLPSPPVKVLEEILETAVMEFARRRTHLLMRDVERVVRAHAAIVFFQNIRPMPKKRLSKQPRWAAQVVTEFQRHMAKGRNGSIVFGDITDILNEEETDIDMKRARDRPPTPVPSKTKLAEVTFCDRCDELTDPVANASNLPERRKMIEMVNAAAKLLSRSVSHRVEKGMDITVGTVTLPNMRHPMEWGEAVEGLAGAVVDNRVHADNGDVRRVSEFLAHRVLRSLLAEMKEEKQKREKELIMQLLPDHQALLASVKDLGQTMFESSDMEVKEKRSSNASLLLMNPVASGDNVATGLASAHKLKEELPPLVPCCEGRELQITEDLARSGLSAISVRHDSVVQSLSSSRACDKLRVAPGLVKNRNSFRCLHRPDLKRVPYLRRMSPDELEMLFRGYADFPSCASRSESQEDGLGARLTSEENIRIKDLRTKDNGGPDDGNVSGLHPIPEMRSGAEDLPAGMRLHGARARLYTSVLAGAKAGDQLDGESLHEDTAPRDQEVILVPDEEVVLHEELQIILPPRCDDVTTASTPSTTLTENSLDS